MGRHLNTNTNSSQTHLSKHPKTPRSLSSSGGLSESAPRPLHYRVCFSIKSTSGLKAKRRSPRGSAPPPSPTRSLPLENAKAATGTGYSAEAPCPGHCSLPEGRRHAWGGTQSARSLDSPAPSEGGDGPRGRSSMIVAFSLPSWGSDLVKAPWRDPTLSKF